MHPTPLNRRTLSDSRSSSFDGDSIRPILGKPHRYLMIAIDRMNGTVECVACDALDVRIRAVSHPSPRRAGTSATVSMRCVWG